MQRKPVSQRTDYHRMPVDNPDRRQRERLATAIIITSYFAAAGVGALIHALAS